MVKEAELPEFCETQGERRIRGLVMLHAAIKEFTLEPDGINFSLAFLHLSQLGFGFRQVIFQLVSIRTEFNR